jgi:hypothetical protein
VIITSLGAREDVNAAVHSYGGVVLHDVINDKFAHKAIEKGADGLIPVAAGAGGHAGHLSPFALIQALREWFDGPIALSGSIAHGRSILGAQAMGADLAYAGSAFIATKEARADPAYQEMIVASTGEDITYTNLFTGVHGNYLTPSILAAGLDPANLPTSDASAMNFGSGGNSKAKAWRDIWGCGQGIGAVTDDQAADADEDPTGDRARERGREADDELARCRGGERLRSRWEAERQDADLRRGHAARARDPSALQPQADDDDREDGGGRGGHDERRHAVDPRPDPDRQRGHERDDEQGGAREPRQRRDDRDLADVERPHGVAGSVPSPARDARRPSHQASDPSTTTSSPNAAAAICQNASG